MEKTNIGLVGLGVMGQNLVLNMERNGYKVAVFNRTAEKTKLFLENEAKGKAIIGVFSYSDLMKSLEKPRRILLMVKAGQPVDDVIAEITPYLEKGDILIDGGNSHFMDTERRNVALSGEGFNFIGTGVSGGEEGALWGPSIMPGGQLEAWDALKSIFGKS
jgi:6-phosphogluconate dehydrogenase